MKKKLIHSISVTPRTIAAFLAETQILCVAGNHKPKKGVIGILGTLLMTAAVCGAQTSPVIVWGSTLYGQTTVPPEATNVIALTGGDSHCLALRADGTIVAWGGYDEGLRAVPTSATNVVGIAAGSWHSLAVRRDGSLLVFGDGVGASGITNAPDGLTNVAAVGLGPGAQHALVLRRDGTVFDFGSSGSYASALTNIPAAATNVVSVAAGAFHSLALRADGTVVAWGDNQSGQTRVPASASNVVAISAGWYHNLALCADGRLIQWGRNTAGASVGSVPTALTNAVDFACGGYHSVGLRADGKLFAWGSNSRGQTTIPSVASNVVAVAATGSDSLALVGWGSPFITTPLLGRSVLTGGSAYFRATATGMWPLAYQWQFNGVDLPGATNALLVISAAQPAQAGAYSVEIRNALGVASSSSSWLTVLPKQSAILSDSLVVTNGQATFLATSPSGLVWSVQASTNLLDWVDLQAITNGTGTMVFSEPATNPTERFYRLRLVP